MIINGEQLGSSVLHATNSQSESKSICLQSISCLHAKNTVV